MEAYYRLVTLANGNKTVINLLDRIFDTLLADGMPKSIDFYRIFPSDAY